MKLRYRVWDGNKMWYPEHGTFLLDQDGRVCQFISEDFDCFEMREYENAVAMLSTGLEDKNGKEVWEGDIVKYNVAPRSPYYRVMFTEGCFMACRPDNSVFEYLHLLDENIEVIGNSMENPELIPKK